ncbi:MAG: sugar phosphate isomerase/epimerase [Armatimonadetes bacterium]|nr:sugar phosphate isomerase/epimerase [Armatimonadota bacterium]
MKLGYLTNFSEDELKLASNIGFDGLEVHAKSWAADDLQSPDRRAEASARASELAGRYGITVTAIAHYERGNPADPKARIESYRSVIEFCSAMKVPVVATLTGGDPDAGLEDNVKLWTNTFSEVARIAEASGVKVAFENWPGFGAIPPCRSVNFGFSPTAWEMMFDAVDSPALGLEFDPSHLVWQQADYLSAAKRFGSRIHHVHLKDTEIMEDKLAEHGSFGGGWWRYRIPGFGLVDWMGFFSVLYEIGYDGGTAIEHEDGVFSGPKRADGLKLGYEYLRPMIL